MPLRPKRVTCIPLEACFAEDGRVVTRSREIRGRTALAEAIETFLQNTDVLRVRVTSVIDASGTTFRVRRFADCRNGMSLEAFDAGEFDATGRSRLVLTFAGPLRDSPQAGLSFSLRGPLNGH